MQKRVFRQGTGINLALALVVTALATPAVLAQWGSGSSLFTEDGVEIAVDSRVVAVFGMLNALGYDRETIFGPEPLRRPQFSEARVKARKLIGRPGEGMQAFTKVVEKNPLPPAAYTRAALELGNAPRFTPSKDASALTKAIYEPLRLWFNEEGGATLNRTVTREGKAAQKKVASPVNKMCRTLGKIAKLGDEEDQLLDESGPSGRVIVALNPLDAHGTLLRRDLGELTYIVAGPLRDGDTQPVVDAAGLAFARTLVRTEAEKNAGPTSLAAVYTKLSKAGQKAMGSQKELATELVACALVWQVSKKLPPVCPASPIEALGKEDRELLSPVLTTLNGRMSDHAKGDALLTAAMSTILGAAPAPEAPAAEAAPAPQVPAAAKPAQP